MSFSHAFALFTRKLIRFVAQHPSRPTLSVTMRKRAVAPRRPRRS